MPSDDCFTFSTAAGLIEPCVNLGEPIREGDLLLRLHPVDRLGQTPTGYRARLDGVLLARHFPGLAQPGDCLAVVAASAGLAGQGS
jgi:N-alpha-acetyl-L-2,4-diaminobutyrate deacetylase